MSAFATAPPPMEYEMEMEMEISRFPPRREENVEQASSDPDPKHRASNSCNTASKLCLFYIISFLFTAIVMAIMGVGVNIYIVNTFTRNVNQVYLKQTETFFQLTSSPISPETLVIYGGFDIPAWKEFPSFICSVPGNTPARLGTFSEMCEISSFADFQRLLTCSTESCAPFNQTLNQKYSNFFEEYCSPSRYRGKYQYELFYPNKCEGIVPVGYYNQKRINLLNEWEWYPLIGMVGVWVVGSLVIIVKNLVCSTQKYQRLSQEDA